MQSTITVPDMSIERINAGVDWISCSLDAGAREDQAWLLECYRVLEQVAMAGHQREARGLMGYRGLMAGGCFVGTRDDSHYCQLSGSYAQAYLARIRRPDLHVSRIDVAVTIRYRVMPNDLGERHYSEAVEADRQQSKANRHRKIWYMSGSDGGYTLYVGSPSSEQRARIYNKEVQSDNNEFSRCWRYECVYRNKAAMAVYKALTACLEAAQPTLCTHLVETWCNARGIPVDWNTGAKRTILPITRQAPSDASKRLLWLEKQVKPAIRWLVEKGYRNEVYNALGLDE